MRLRRKRGPVYGPPAPPPGPCGSPGAWPFQRCDKPEGHSGLHGRIIGTSTTTGGLVNKSSVTREGLVVMRHSASSVETS